MSHLEPLLVARIQHACKRFGLEEGCAKAKVFLKKTEPQIQSGPTCGFVSLSLAAGTLGLSTKPIADLLDHAQRKEYTNDGEMFSAQWLSDIAKGIWPEVDAEVVDFPEPTTLVNAMLDESAVFLVPYDCDKNFEPAMLNGEAAHWAAIVGFVEVADACEDSGEVIEDYPSSSLGSTRTIPVAERLFLLAFQGKSRHAAVWSFESMQRSNAQLNVPDSRRSEAFRMPPDGMDAIRGRAIKLRRPI